MSIELTTFDAIMFPADGRQPHIVSLMTSPMPTPYGSGPSSARMPHPEIYMDFIAEGLGPRGWKYQLVEALDGMNKKFASPYIIFYPIVSNNGMPFPINKCIREIQGRAFREDIAWRGNVVIGKFTGSPFEGMIAASMADFPILKNYLLTHASPL